MKTSDFYYDLPQELIAQTPLEKRDASRLMVLHRADGALEHRHFFDVIDYLQPGDCLVMNDSRVLPARLLGHRVPSGGAAEVLLLTDKGDGLWECLVKPGRKLHEGAEISFGDGVLTATVEQESENGNRLVRTASVIRRSIRVLSVQQPHRPQDCILQKSCWKRLLPRVFLLPMSRCTSVLAPSDLLRSRT